jgi:tetratricopeptide (TPR) repeat protein
MWSCNISPSEKSAINTPIDTLQVFVRTADSLASIRPDSAIQLYRKIVDVSTIRLNRFSDTDTTRAELVRSKALAQRGIAVAFSNTGRLTDALSLIDQALLEIEAYRYILPSLYYHDYTALANSKGVFQKKLGNYSDALKTYQDAVSIALQYNDSASIAIFHTNTANIYQEIGEPEMALEYISKALDLHKKQGNDRGVAVTSLTLANILNSSGQFAEAFPNYQTALNFCETNGLTGNVGLIQSNLGVLEKRLGNYADAEEYFLKAEENLEKAGNKQGLALVYGNLADLEIERQSWGKAINYASSQLAIAKQTSTLVNQRYAYKHLSKAYAAMGNYWEAYHNHLQYSSINDSIISLEKRNEISRLEAVFQDERKTEEINHLASLSAALEKKNTTKNYLIISISMLLLATILLAFLWIYSAKLKSKQQRLILEHQLFRSQMNPHFLFNSLSAIQNMVYRADKLVAAELVASFAKFIRLILDSSRSNLVPLQSEIEAINLFLDLQKVRFPNLFNYSITLDTQTDVADIMIPPLIVQPFVENSVIHGFAKDRTDGMIQIKFVEANNSLYCEVIDNGIGISKAKEKKEGTHKSLATQITRDRLSVLCKQLKCRANFEYEDIDSDGGGTRLTLKLPLLFSDSLSRLN